MARCALFLRDLLGQDCAIVDHSGYNQSLPVGNVSTPLPGEVFEQLEGPFFNGAAGMFEVSPATEQTIVIDEGGGDVSTTIPDGAYDANALALAIETALNNGPLAATDYSVGYGVATRKFVVAASGGFIIRNGTANVLTSQCGYDGPDTSNSTIHVAENARSSVITRVKFDAGAGNTVAPDLIWTLLNSTGGADASPATLYGTVNVYGHATNLGNLWGTWAASASESAAMSARPAEDENTIQAAVLSGAGYRFWFVAWEHKDDHTSHQIGVLRGAAALTSSVHTVREVSSHHLANRTAPRTLENQHPVNLLSDWRMSIELERWTASEFRAFKVEADRYGAADGMLFSLLWTDIVAGSLTVDAQADKGQLFYGAIVGSSTDSYAGSESDYMTGALDLAQLRGP